MRTLVWFRNDLRVADNAALHRAMQHGEAVAVFCACPSQWRSHDVGDNRTAFLADNVHRLGGDLDALGVPLVGISEPWFSGVPARLAAVAHALGAGAVSFNREYPMNERQRDRDVTRTLEASGIAVHAHDAGTVLPPGSVLTRRGEPFAVFTPFKRRWLETLTPGAAEPLPVPRRQKRTDVETSPVLASFEGIERTRLIKRWPAGTDEALERLRCFLRRRASHYHENRNFPAGNGTSTLSPYLSVGSISARQCLSEAMRANDGKLHGGSAGITTWINALIWRDFYRHVVALFPHVSRGRPFQPAMDRLPWRQANPDFDAWRAGRTGFPLVDAAMRQLSTTGWMHNRLRMLTAMFLTKHLLIDWRLGERHFMNALVDGDFAANNGGWQWSASTGTDAVPYFRIFNPNTQARRFDPDGSFIRHHVTELAHAPLGALFDPARHPIARYPRPIVDLPAARRRALETYSAVRRG